MYAMFDSFSYVRELFMVHWMLEPSIFWHLGRSDAPVSCHA